MPFTDDFFFVLLFIGVQGRDTGGMWVPIVCSNVAYRVVPLLPWDADLVLWKCYTPIILQRSTTDFCAATK
jgi:hypothetical protein